MASQYVPYTPDARLNTIYLHDGVQRLVAVQILQYAIGVVAVMLGWCRQHDGTRSGKASDRSRDIVHLSREVVMDAAKLTGTRVDVERSS